jgi:hypothetical protein
MTSRLLEMPTPLVTLLCKHLFLKNAKNRNHLQNAASSHKRTQMAMSVIGRGCVKTQNQKTQVGNALCLL